MLEMSLIINDLWLRYRDQNGKLGCFARRSCVRDGSYGSRGRVLRIKGGIMYAWMLDIEGEVRILLQEWMGVKARVVWCMARVDSALSSGVHVPSDCHSNIILSGGMLKCCI